MLTDNIPVGEGVVGLTLNSDGLDKLSFYLKMGRTAHIVHTAGKNDSFPSLVDILVDKGCEHPKTLGKTPNPLGSDLLFDRWGSDPCSINFSHNQLSLVNHLNLAFWSHYLCSQVISDGGILLFAHLHTKCPWQVTLEHEAKRESILPFVNLPVLKSMENHETPVNHVG